MKGLSPDRSPDRVKAGTGRGMKGQVSNSVRDNWLWRMMEPRVPGFSSLCKGTGTVMVLVPSFFCITRWLPLWRTASKPCARSRSQMSWPEKTLRLGIFRFELGDPSLAAEATPDLTR